METQSVTKYFELPKLDCRDLFFTKLCNDTGYALVESALKGNCQCAETNEIMLSKQAIKEAILAKRNVLLYLAIDSCRVDEQVYTTYDKAVAVLPFIIVGWSDYESVSVKTPLGVTKRHRGYFIVVPAFREITEEDIHYIPYKHFKISDVPQDETSFINEVWAIDNLETDIIEPKRSGFEFVIGRDCIVCDGISYCTDACPFYHIEGTPLIPIREIVQRLGYTVTWSRFKRSIDIVSHDKHIKIFINQRKCFVNGEEHELNCAPVINKYTKRAYVNLSFIRHILGLEAKFEKETETVYVYTDKKNKLLNITL